MNQHLSLGGCSIGGKVKVDILDHSGSVIREGKWQKNLVLNAGLDRLAVVPICDLFLNAVKGNDTLVVREAVPGTTLFALDSIAATVTATGLRSFTSADIGKLIYSPGTGIQAIINAIAGPTVADVVPVTPFATISDYSGQSCQIYAVGATGMLTELGRTNTYSAIAGENSTVALTNTRTHKRTFLFAPEAAAIETVSGTYSWATTHVTRNTGSRNFVSADIGAYIKFPGTGDFAKIVSITSTSVVVVDRPPTGTNSSAAITIYGYQSYTHIGFSDSSSPGANLNIFVRLEDGSGNPTPVRVLGATPETGGQQLKVAYTLLATFHPENSTSGSGLFSDPSGAMGAGSKDGVFALERISASFIATDGSTDISDVALEPYAGGSVGLSTSSASLVPLSSAGVAPDRSIGATYVPMTPDTYVPGNYQNIYSGTFGINEGNGVNWRSMGIFDATNSSFCFVYLFNAVQKKPSTHSFTLHFGKSWDRDLS